MPGALDERLGLSENRGFWLDGMEEAGWEMRHSPEGELTTGITVYERLETGDLLVVADDIESRMFSFLVGAEDRDIFMATEYLVLRARWAQGEQLSQQQKLTKALIAFVRHGHGDTTVSEDGTVSLDERRREIRNLNAARGTHN